ncbi:hypothetical protein K466DRAFT_503536 [Polyporus arcularius HHB13444]|uniref:hAT-like transposase RNase-H fold domain-containing protein n=1 Tax=Polyporus arcularius HHB13444 TaxID=1314778 RepID=A0A5C3P4F4_9APHY|nr:hypothetical protein K466DRAFT_503536 [Polyporus arcularius HHB13444]
MLDVAVKYREAVEDICSKVDLGLRAYELTAREWTIAIQLHNVLKIFKDGTTYFSRGSPNLARVIPAMDLIDMTLTNQIRDETRYDHAIRTSLARGKKLLNRYYKLSDMSATYRIALMLHPSYKDQYFKQAGWPSSWIKDAQEMLQDEYDRCYRGSEVLDDAEPQAGNTQPSMFARKLSSKRKRDDSMADVPEVRPSLDTV